MAQQVVGRQTACTPHMNTSFGALAVSEIHSIPSNADVQRTSFQIPATTNQEGRQEVYMTAPFQTWQRFSDAMNPALVESSDGTVPWATSTNTEFHGGQLDVKSTETRYFAHSMEPYGKQNQYGPPGASESTFGQTYMDQISISGTVNPHHTTALTQWLKNNPTFTSVIRRVFLRDRASFQAVAVEFFNQTNDPLLSRAVWGHGRFTRDESMPFLYSGFKVKESSYNGVNFDLITAPDVNSWLPEHHQVNFRDLIDVLSPFMDRSYQNLLVDYVYAVLAALYKLPINERKIYLEHQTYLNGWVCVDWSFLEQGTARVTALYGQHVQVLRPDGDVWRVL
ncbi:hypothetical protein B0H14DRAFT_2594432 [Mycena olivaceomarginata]|nr:hypothetical protein B0H14DRAFT_2594432 [Mycena olivaceomarginata]